MNILIVGGGASGTIAAIALQRAGFMGEEINIAEPRDLLGEGLAYQTRDPLHRLNVPSGRMSAIEDLPDDFAKWSDVEPYTFMQRQSYSTYLRERLGSAVNHIQENIVDLVPTQVGAVATLSSGQSKSYDSVILALGHGEARIPEFLVQIPDSPRIIKDVWNCQALPHSRNLICFGTGLTFIDMAMTHLARDPRNNVIAISGSGNLPERHVASAITPFKPRLEDVSTLEKLRSYLSTAGESWREAIDGLRPITEAMWRGFTMQEREEFLRTDGSSWSRRRHRIAPEIADRVESEIASGRMTIYKGHVERVLASLDLVEIELSDGTLLRGDYLAICIGRDYQLTDPLSLSLINNGKTNRGPLAMGLSIDVDTGQLQAPDGMVYPGIFAIGPLRSGEAFESTAIPEIRKQAYAIARRLGEQAT